MWIIDIYIYIHIFSIKLGIITHYQSGLWVTNGEEMLNLKTFSLIRNILWFCGLKIVLLIECDLNAKRLNGYCDMLRCMCVCVWVGCCIRTSSSSSSVGLAFSSCELDASIVEARDCGNVGFIVCGADAICGWAIRKHKFTNVAEIQPQRT